MKFLIVLSAFVLFCTSAQNRSSVRSTTHPNLLITECADDGYRVFVPESQSRTRIALIGDVDLEAAFRSENEEDGATFWFVRKGKTIFSFTAKDLSADGVWIAVDREVSPALGFAYNHVALTYSDGGAIGNFHVRVFQIDGDVITDLSKTIEGAVGDFKARHYCKERGNNVTALKWVKGDLLLMAQVYPTGDCGSDLGHIEAYRVSMPDGKILQHLTLEQLKQFPGVCLENDDEH